jgi:hypothetical protein
MIETVNGTMSFRDGSQSMKIDTSKLYDLIKTGNDLSKPFAICGKKFMGKIEGDMTVGLNHPKKKTGDFKRSVILRVRYEFEGKVRYATLIVSQTDSIGFAGCRGYSDEPIALRDQLKAALNDMREAFSPPELFDRDVPIVINNSTFNVPYRPVVVQRFMNFLRDKNFPEIDNFSLSTRQIRIRLVEQVTLSVLASGKNKVFGAKSEDAMNRVTEFIHKIYAEFDEYEKKVETMMPVKIVEPYKVKPAEHMGQIIWHEDGSGTIVQKIADMTIE